MLATKKKSNEKVTLCFSLVNHDVHGKFKIVGFLRRKQNYMAKIFIFLLLTSISVSLN